MVSLNLLLFYSEQKSLKSNFDGGFYEAGRGVNKIRILGN
jgi:hypothetical protein